VGLPRIVYNNKHVDFSVPLRIGSGWNKEVSGSTIRMPSGVTEEVFLSSQHFPVFVLQNETTDIVQYLDDFYDYAQDGSTFDIVMDRDFGAYYAFNNNVRSNDTTLATFTRALTTDSSYYVDPDTGLLTVVNTVDIPRFPSGQFTRGLLIEGARTNIITFPSAFDNAAWTKSANITVPDANTTETDDPAGANNADLVTSTSTLETLTFTSGTAVGNDVAVSVWAKTRSGNVTFQFLITGTGGGTTTSSTMTATPTWQRFTFTADTSGYTTDLEMVIRLTGASSIYLYGAQMEDSSTFASTNIGAVSAASVARGADLLIASVANDLNREQMSVMFWFTPDWTAGSQGTTKTLFQSGTSVTNGHIRLAYLNTTANLFFEAFLNNSTTVNQAFDSSGAYMIAGTAVHLALTVDSTTGTLLLYANGALVETDSNDAFNISDTGDQIAIGSNIDGSSPAHGVFSDFVIFKDIMTANEISQYFNQTRGLGFRNNRMTCRLRDKSRRPQYGNGERFNLTIPFEEVLV